MLTLINNVPVTEPLIVHNLYFIIRLLQLITCTSNYFTDAPVKTLHCNSP